jgi:hypothetical protein
MDSLTIVASSPVQPKSSIGEIIDLVSSIGALVGSMAWPIAAVIIFSIFRKQIVSLIPRVKKVTAGNNGIEFADQAQIGEAIIELGDRVVPEKKKIEEAKNALVQKTNLSEDEKEKLTRELIKSTQKVAQLEDEKQRLRDIILDWEKSKSLSTRPTKRSLLPEFILPTEMVKKMIYSGPNISESEKKRKTILTIVQEIGADLASNMGPDELRTAFKAVCQKIRQGTIFPDLGEAAILELNSAGLINIYDALTPTGVSITKSYARDIVEAKRFNKP